MKFTLTVDTDLLTGELEQELSRILRYWAGNLKHYELAEGTRETLMDSSSVAVGEWKLAATSE